VGVSRAIAGEGFRISDKITHYNCHTSGNVQKPVQLTLVVTILQFSLEPLEIIFIQVWAGFDCSQ
jgi:hypothetical protein